ncbi:hypothetical protein LTR56_017792 [Elasticomyces elasticus]|nr:hypothetical protein LTR56_017792 [Elasticomyces elasticus]KAK3662293.1 hypothetical protein LTR22_006826 [Elasticomyces elasticus]KAK4924768.1 hypothetical protein LTR49_008217 [Elasticomyces elasticus]KAK5766826.1 hypothetical protein LTS12_002902 [Elasticomyces elasticus]
MDPAQREAINGEYPSSYICHLLTLIGSATLSCPRFLFRASSNESRGGPAGNTAFVIDPLAKTDEAYSSRFTHLDWEDADLQLETHFGYQYKHPSPFSSWSTSLLWVLVHAVRKAVVYHETNVLIYVLDTGALVGQERVFSARRLVEMLAVSNSAYQRDGWLKHVYKYSVGEYIVHGKLYETDGFKSVSLDTLVKAGLFESVPTLDLQARLDGLARQAALDAPDFSPESIERDKQRRQNTRKWSGLHQRIHQLRFAFFHVDEEFRETRKKLTKPNKKGHRKIRKRDHRKPEPDNQSLTFGKTKIRGKEFWPLPQHYSKGLKLLGECFGETWACTMTLAFVSLRRRDLTSVALQDVLSSLDGLPLKPMSQFDNDSSIHDHIEERMQFLHLLHRMRTRREDGEDVSGSPKDAAGGKEVVVPLA